MKEYRTKQINFRVTESEYARINERMQVAGIKHPSAYFRKMAMDGYILKLDLGDLQEIQRLARINANKHYFIQCGWIVSSRRQRLRDIWHILTTISPPRSVSNALPKFLSNMTKSN